MSSYADPTLSWCCALGSPSNAAFPHQAKACPKATTLQVRASKTPSSPLYFVHSNAVTRNKHSCSHQQHATTDGAEGEENDGTPHRIPFSNIDPADEEANQRAVENLLRIASGQSAREVTHRLTKISVEAHQREMQRLRDAHSIKLKVARKDPKSLENYVQEMLVKGQARRREKLRKIESEMYPLPVPKISEMSKQIVKTKREEQRSQGKPLTRLEDRHRFSPKRAASSSAEGGGKKRKRPLHEFKPAGPVHHDGSSELFLVSVPTPRCPSPRPTAPLTEEQKLQRFKELSRPRPHQMTPKRQ